VQRLLVVLLLIVIVAAGVYAKSKEEKRLESCAEVVEEILGVPENIPQELLDKAECIGVIPGVKKVAFGFGGSYGRGAFLCRSGLHFNGAWTAPAMYRLEGGSIGFQLGGSETDFILLVMNPNGAKAIIRSKVKLGADALVAGGPKGRTAEAATDATMRAEILTYSRSRGLFAGVSLKGSTLRADKGANEKVYGRELEAKQILREGTVGVPASAEAFVALLNKHSPKNLSDD
jgi:lipid-binding SYLF domain-containing protein